MKTLGKGLKHYNEIYKNMENATIIELAEAKVYFDSVGGEFKDKSKVLSEKIEKFSKGDLFKEIGSDSEEICFDASTTFILKDISRTIETVNIDAVEKLKDKIAPKYFKTITVTVVDKELILTEYKDGTIDPSLKPYVTIMEHTALGFRKKPVKKTATKGSK